MTERPLVLVACSARKLDRAAPAAELYQGDLFAKCRAYAEAFGAQWLILSALHHVVEPGRVLEPYDTRVPQARDKRRAWSMRVAYQLYQHRDRPIVCLAGDDYCGWIHVNDRSHFRDGVWTRTHIEFPTVKRPLEGLGIGLQKSWLKAQLSAVPA